MALTEARNLAAPDRCVNDEVFLRGLGAGLTLEVMTVTSHPRSGSLPSFQIAEWWVNYHRVTRLPAGAALTALPLVLVYGLGLLLTSPEARSGVDVVTGHLLAGLGVRGYIAVQLSLAVVVIAYAIWHLRRRTLRVALLTGPVMLEAALYGLVMGTLILAVMKQQHLLGPMLDPGEHLERLVVAAGAGLHEELVFRVLLIPVLALVGTRLLAMPVPVAWAGAALVSSLAFAGAHHLGGEAFTHFAFAYRTFAGLVFACIYLCRGFAVAAWTHAAYDLHVLYGTA